MTDPDRPHFSFTDDVAESKGFSWGGSGAGSSSDNFSFGGGSSFVRGLSSGDAAGGNGEGKRRVLLKRHGSSLDGEPAAKRPKTIHAESQAVDLVDYTDEKDRAQYFLDLLVVDQTGCTHYFHRMFVSPVLAAALIGETKSPATLHFTVGTELTRLVLNCMQRGDGPIALALTRNLFGDELAALISFAFQYDWKLLPLLERAAVAKASNAVSQAIWEALREAKRDGKAYATAYLNGAASAARGQLPTMPADFWVLCTTIPASLNAHIYTGMRAQQYDEKHIRTLVEAADYVTPDGPIAKAITFSHGTIGVSYPLLHSVLLEVTLAQLQKTDKRLKSAEPLYQFVAGDQSYRSYDTRTLRERFKIAEPDV